MAGTFPADPVCTRCKENPQRYPKTKCRWCLDCINTYQRSYKKSVRKRSEDRGFRRGVEAARALLVAEFTMNAGIPLTAGDVAKIIERRLERP